MLGGKRRNAQRQLMLLSSIVLVVLCTFFLSATYYNDSLGPDVHDIISETRNDQRELLDELREFYKQQVEQQVKHNNWNMGCADLALLGPYFRAILDRLDSGKPKERRLLFDVGANNGQDADTIMGNFHKIVGICNSFSTSFTVVSIEPSPQVFCELEELVAKRGWEPPAQEIIRLNIGMSDETGFLRFSDPGDEGGKLLGAVKHIQNRTLGDTMTEEEFKTMTQCKDTGDHNIDHHRITTVPTYSMDTLVAALQSLNQPLLQKGNEIFFLKIDTEGHDKSVIKGAGNLLAQKRIVFVLFEVWNNANIRDIVDFMDKRDYACFIISPKMLIPVHPQNWWYDHLNTDIKGNWWGNGVCGIRGSSSLSMLFRMFHSDNDFLLKAHDHVVMTRAIDDEKNTIPIKL